jgi:hypothetical protein
MGLVLLHFNTVWIKRYYDMVMANHGKTYLKHKKKTFAQLYVLVFFPAILIIINLRIHTALGIAAGTLQRESLRLLCSTNLKLKTGIDIVTHT